MRFLQGNMPTKNYTDTNVPTCPMQGFRDKYHKDEYHKLNKHWSNQHESGKYDKYGQHGEHHHNHEEQSDKGGSHAVSQPIFISAPHTSSSFEILLLP